MIQHASVMTSVSDPLLVGALTTHAWLCLVGHRLSPLHIPPGVLDSYLPLLDSNSFPYHYHYISRLVLQFDSLRLAWHHHDSGINFPLAWARLEYECLLVPIKLPRSLVDLRDEMPATPEAVILHCLQNLLFLSLYAYVFDRQDTLGNMLCLRPVPGVMNFLCALARSIFVCRRDIVDRWRIIADAQATTVQLMLRLWQVTQFQTCKAILNLWDSCGQFPELVEQVREQIGQGTWEMEMLDGYSVFWTFRDLRSLALSFHIQQLTSRGMN
jgi:hypothetical protein